jgi:diguanylate cyclase (GGDEF)-like protein
MTLEEPVRAQPGTPEPADRKPLAGLVDDRGERILRTALSLTALLVACSVVGGVALGVVDASGMRIRVLMLGITLVTLAALRRWGVTAAVRFFLYSGVALVASHSLAVSGVRTPVLLALAPMLVLAGWFLGRREVFSLGAAAAASVAGMAHLEYVGLLVPAPRTVFDYLWALVVVIPVSSVIGIHAHSRFVHQLTLAQLGAKRLQLINELSSQVHGMRDVESILRGSIDAIVSVTAAPGVVSYLCEPDGVHLRLVASHGFDAEYQRLFARIDMDGSWAGLALEQRRPLLARDIAAEPRFTQAARDALIAGGLRTGIVIPLRDEATPLGFVALFYADADIPFVDESEMKTLDSVSRTLSMAIVNARQVGHLRHQARHDALTGLPNRASLHEAFDEIATRAGLGQRPAVMLLDLDRFKEINDALGHHTGDRLLAALAQRLVASAGSGGALTCRLGGDEFAVVLPHVGTEGEALALARAISDALAQPFEMDGTSLRVGASVGVAVFPEHGTDSHELLRAADVAMYRAKALSLGACLYDREADTHSPARLALITDLGNAISRGELVMHYQPKIDLRTGGIAGFEALVRWQHPTQGLLYPAAFIHLAEASEVVHPFTRAVLERSMKDCATLRRHGLFQPIALNLSARNLIDDRCVQDIERLIAANGLHYADIELEITETAIMHDPAQVARLLSDLDRRGVGLAIDDFGTGYSSLAHLKRLPLDALKVDRSFVRDMATDEHDAAIVRSTVALAHSLGMEVTAEGVENAATVAMLRAMGCDMIQGFHISRPLPLAALLEWAAAHSAERAAEPA